MKLITSLLILTLLLTACNLPSRPGPTEQTANTAPGEVSKSAPSATPATLIFMPQQMQGGSSQSETQLKFYFWLNPVPLGLTINTAKSYADESSFSLELEKPGVQAAVMGGDLAEAAWEEAVKSGAPVTVRNLPGYAFTAPGGVTLHWIENNTYFLAGGLGMSLEDAQTLVNALEAINMETFQARLSQ